MAMQLMLQTLIRWLRVFSLGLYLVVFCFFIALFATGCRDSKPPAKETPLNMALEGVYRSAEGGIVTLRPPTDGLTVIFFYTEDCPISNFYIPVLNELVRRHGVERVRWVGACVDPDLSPENQLKHARDYAIDFPVIGDQRGELAFAVGVKTTPEVVVFDAHGQLLYRGRIDDHYAARGVKSAVADNHDLDSAVVAGLAGRLPERRETEAVGCPLPEVAPRKESKITVTEHIAPLIYRNCLECHRPGSIAPFSLETYQQARRRADDLVDVTASKFMPPSRLDPKFGQRIQHDISLSDAEIQLFAKWAKQGALEGDVSKMPERPVFREGWQLGEPDAILEMPEAFTVPAHGSDIYRCFVIPTDFGKDMFVTAVEYLPGSPTAMHHILSYIDTTGESKILDSRDPAPGYECFGSPGTRVSGELGAASPGFFGEQLPNGIARGLPHKADIVLQMHYSPTGKVETDRTRIGLHFAKKPVEHVYLWFPVQNSSFKIPAGASSHEVVASRVTPFDLIALTVMPHMHMLGKDMEVWIEKPSGERMDLLRVAPWDFKWQRSYTLAKRVKIPAGSRIVARAHYDNSSKNPLNPNRKQPQAFSFGERTTNEMCIAMLGVIRPEGGATTKDAKSAFETLWQPQETQAWKVWTSAEVGQATLDQSSTGFRLKLQRAAAQADRWRVQAMYPVSVTKGTTYEVALKLKADAPRGVTWSVLQNHRPYEHLCASEEIQLTGDWQIFRKTFTADRDEPNAQIVIAAGGSSVPFDIAEITIKGGPADKPKSAPQEPSE